jgi:hypothetical protein
VREGQHDGRPERLGREAPGLPDQLSDVVRRRLRSATNNEAVDQLSGDITGSKTSTSN